MLNWVEVDAGAIRANLAVFRDKLRESGGATRLAAVVKSNAYGHGILEVARIAVDAGADWLCVNNAAEGVLLREAGHDRPIHVMGYVPVDGPQGLDAVVAHDLQPVVYQRAAIERLQERAVAAGRTAHVHLKLETGTHRQGVPEDEAERLAAAIRDAPNLELAGMTTHFANIEDTTDHGFAAAQIACFERLTARLAAGHGRPPLRHAACSAAALLFPRVHLDLARIGISLYGLWPSRETLVSCRDRGAPAPVLRPALTWKTRIAQVKPVPEGGFVGYGCAWRATRDSRIAVLPVGYHEGYDRRLSGVGHVLIRGRRAPVRGRVCMNMCMVDVTDVPAAAVEDEVVLLGRQGDERVPAEQLAAWCGTIAYEVVARIHPGLPRVVVETGDEAGI